MLTTILSNLESSNSYSKEGCNGDGNYSMLMAITSVDSKDGLSELVKEFGVHSDFEKDEVSDDEEVYLNEGDKKIQDVYEALLEDCGKYAKVAMSVVKKMKRIEKDHKSTLAQLNDAKCEVEDLKDELLNAYSKIKFLELEVIQANVKVERITTKKLDNVLSFQKPFSNKTELGYTSEGSLSAEPGREMKFVFAKNVEKPKIKILRLGKSPPKSQRGPQVKHFCHHYGIREHTRPNCFKLHVLKRADFLHAQGNERRMLRGKQAKGENNDQLIRDVMEMLKNILSCLASFTLRFKSYVNHTPPSKDLTQITHAVWAKKGTHA